jgi:hypothetical protein
MQGTAGRRWVLERKNQYLSLCPLPNCDILGALTLDAFSCVVLQFIPNPETSTTDARRVKWIVIRGRMSGE